MNKRKSQFTYEQWKEKQLRVVEDCYENTEGRGEKTFYSILCTCARYYPKHIVEFAQEFNAKKCFPPFSEEEVEHKIEDALKQSGNFHVVRHREVKANEKLINSILERVKARIGEETPKDFISKKSPVDVSKVDALTFLKTVFREGEYVYIADVQASAKPYLMLKIEKNMECNPELDMISRYNMEGVWFVSNPVNGIEMLKPDGKGYTYRSKCNITDYRYCLVESDTVSQDDWALVLTSLCLPFAAIYSSGGKSIHSLIYIGADTPEKWKAEVDAIKPYLIELGADRQTYNISRMTRLPQCVRGNTGEMQELLYLNPDPKPLIIMDQVERRGDSNNDR